MRIEKKDDGGIVRISFFNKDDLRALLERIDKEIDEVALEAKPLTEEEKILAEDKPKADEDESLYSVSNFSI